MPNLMRKSGHLFTKSGNLVSGTSGCVCCGSSGSCGNCSDTISTASLTLAGVDVDYSTIGTTNSAADIANATLDAGSVVNTTFNLTNAGATYDYCLWTADIPGGVALRYLTGGGPYSCTDALALNISSSNSSQLYGAPAGGQVRVLLYGATATGELIFDAQVWFGSDPNPDPTDWPGDRSTSAIAFVHMATFTEIHSVVSPPTACIPLSGSSLPNQVTATGVFSGLGTNCNTTGTVSNGTNGLDTVSFCETIVGIGGTAALNLS